MSNALAVDVTACPSCGETCAAPASQCVTCFGKALEARLRAAGVDPLTGGISDWAWAEWVQEQGIGE